jgi:hypothetical protein
MTNTTLVDHEAAKWDAERALREMAGDMPIHNLARAYLDLASRLSAVEAVVGEMRAAADEYELWLTLTVSGRQIRTWADRLQPSAPESEPALSMSMFASREDYEAAVVRLHSPASVGKAVPFYMTPSKPVAAPAGVTEDDGIRSAVMERLTRFAECADDPDADGCDIGREWLDVLTTLGLLKRVQRSPALWEVTPAGEAALSAAKEGE